MATRNVGVVPAVEFTRKRTVYSVVGVKPEITVLATFVVWRNSTFEPCGIVPLLANAFSAPAGARPARAGSLTVHPVMGELDATVPGATVNTSASKLGLVIDWPKS